MVFEIMTIFFFALTLGLILGETLSGMNRKRAEVKVMGEKEKPSSVSVADTFPQGKAKEEVERSRPFPTVEEEDDINPMTLRNGYGVTRDRNPTFAEQWVNIMNFSGECQTEGDYEESGNDAADDLE